MSRGTQLATRVTKVLARIGGLDRQVYKRVITKSGGDELIGRPGTVTYVDTLYDPQPVYKRVGRHAEILSTNNRHLVADDYIMTFSAEMVTSAQLQRTDFVIVLKDASGNEETLRVIDDLPSALNGVEVAHTVFLRSVKR